MVRKRNHNPFDIATQAEVGGLGVRSGRIPDWLDIPSGRKRQKHAAQSLPIRSGWLQIWFGLALLGLLILGARAYYLQFFQGQHFLAVAEGNRIRIRDIKATRGVVYDRYSIQMVENVPRLTLAVIPVDLPWRARRQEVLEQLLMLSSKSADEIATILDDQLTFSYQPIIIEENISHEQAVAVEIVSSRAPGIVVLAESTRHYLQNDNRASSLSHLLGYPSRMHENEMEKFLSKGYSFDDFVGRAGLELSYEKVLKGENGKEQVEVNAAGEAKEVIARRDAVHGSNLVLTIDFELQQETERLLQAQLDRLGNAKGSAIVLDPNSGEVLALVSLPSYNNNLFARGISSAEYQSLIQDPNLPLFNRAIVGEYPSGSTFKMIVAAAALQEKLITGSTGFQSVGGIGVNRWFFPDWKFGGHGWTTLTKALSESVNTFFYIIGGGYQNFEGLGVERIKTYAEKFGLSKPLGIDLPYEASGFLPSISWKEEFKDEAWYIGDTYHLAIGQGDLLVTPLQMAAWTSIFANGGTLYRPYLVKEITDDKNNPTQEVSPQILSQNIVEPEHIRLVNRGLREGVLTGSARGLSGLPVSVAAKTGTAQWSSVGDPHAWLTAYAPYENPNIVVTVLIEEGEEGSTAAVPVARDVILWWATNR